MGVNMRLFDLMNWRAVEVRFPNGRGWAGEGSFGYRRSALKIGDARPGNASLAAKV